MTDGRRWRLVVLVVALATSLAAACRSTENVGQTVGEVAEESADVAPEQSEGTENAQGEAGSIFTDQAPSFCRLFEAGGTLAAQSPDTDNATRMVTLVDLLEAVESESTSAEIVGAVAGLADQLRPLPEALPEAGDGVPLTELLTPDELGSVMTGSARLQTDEVAGAMSDALIECVPHQIEPVAADVDQLKDRIGWTEGGSGGDAQGLAEGADPERGAKSDSGTDPGPAPATGDTAVLASAASVTMTSADNLVSPAGQPDSGTFEMTVDRVFATSTYGDEQAAAGEKLVVIDYHLIALDGTIGRVDNSTFRLVVSGRTANPINRISGLMAKGDVMNDVIVFTVAAEAMSVSLEAGPPLSLGAGHTATYDVDLESDPDALAHLDAHRAIPDEAIEATATSVTLTAGDEVVTPKPLAPQQGAGLVEILAVATARTYGNEVSGPRGKFVVVDWRFTGTDGPLAALDATTMRLMAEGEWYGPVDAPSEVINPGEVTEVRTVYLVPRTATDLVIQVGALPQTGDGLWAEFTATFE